MALKTLKSRLTQQGSRLATLNPDSWRSTKQKTAERGYGGKWQKAREGWLQAHPLCVMCDELDHRVTAASVVDHRIPHRGDMALFWDRTNWQSLCAHHHSAHKQREEAKQK